MEATQTQQFQRQIACKVWLSNLNNGAFTASQKQGETFTPSYVTCNEKRISRINLVATVVDVFESEDGNYVSITVDDGSSTMRLKAFNDDTAILANIKNGDVLLTIARIREYQDERYLVPEVVKKIEDPNVEVVRKAELLQQVGLPEKEKVRAPSSPFTEEKNNQPQMQQVQVDGGQETVQFDDAMRKRVLEKIAEYEDVGAEITTVAKEISLAEDIVEQVTKALLLEGEVYENKPGHFKVL